ncbi:MAG: lasso peptide biosynthesis B2 protein [Candidatus Rokuibacteriota bacterium]|nr:MAG: lasso peptide biosynthesis B2 protein [Candidatus Rokubacteria bacterium]
MALPPAERAALLRAWVLLFVVELALRAGAARPLIRRVEAGEPIARPGPSVERLGRLVDLATRAVPFPVTCLGKALVVGWLLARAGVVLRLRFGVARRAGRLEAHAWLESGGEPIFGLDASDAYVPLGGAAAR